MKSDLNPRRSSRFDVAVLLALLAGCSTTSDRRDDEPLSTEHVESVADDLVEAAGQIAALKPAETTLQFERQSDGDNPFSQALSRSLSEAGYGIQLVAEPVGEYLVGHRVSHSLYSDAGSAYRFELSIGGISLRRDYRQGSGGTVEPVTAVFVKGVPDLPGEPAADARESSLADADVTTADTSAVPETREASSETASAVNATGLNALQEEGERSPPTLRSAALQSSEVPAELGNVIELGRSNYSEIVEGLIDVEQQTIDFRLGSSLLDNTDVAMIDTVIEQFDAASDVISIIGCSLGPGGQNQSLATTRASRVKQAFLAAGVPGERLLAEACWADRMVTRELPDRGVVMTLKREEI